MAKKGNQFPFARSKGYQEAVKALQEQALKGLAPKVNEFWVAYDKDSVGDPEARLTAIRTAHDLRTVYGMGARKAAQIMGREEGSNAAQRYFDVAKGWELGVWGDEEHSVAAIKASKITTLAADFAAWRKAQTGEPQDSAEKAKRALQTFERIRKAVYKADGVFNCSALLVRHFGGNDALEMMVEPKDRPAIIPADVTLRPVAVVESTEEQEEEHSESGVETIKVGE
jgi:hypothetical protein